MTQQILNNVRSHVSKHAVKLGICALLLTAQILVVAFLFGTPHHSALLDVSPASGPGDCLSVVVIVNSTVNSIEDSTGTLTGKSNGRIIC